MSASLGINTVPVINALDGTKKSSIVIPKCFSTQIRPDVICRVHDLMMKNSRQPHAVNNRAGKFFLCFLCILGYFFKNFFSLL